MSTLVKDTISQFHIIIIHISVPAPRYTDSKYFLADTRYTTGTAGRSRTGRGSGQASPRARCRQWANLLEAEIAAPLCGGPVMKSDRSSSRAPKP